MGWQFVSEEESIKNVKEGKYYAMITILKTFQKVLHLYLPKMFKREK